MRKQRHHLGHFRRHVSAARHACACAGINIIGDTANAIGARFQPVQNRDHFRANSAGQQSQHITARHTVALRFRLGQKRGIKLRRVNFAALKARPGICVWVARIDAANEILRQAVCFFINIEGFKRAGGDNAAKIP